MNTDKAYLLGLIIGGGIFGNAEDVFKIKLPYNKWGSFESNPQRAGQIAGDILRKVGQMFRAVYGLSVQYEAMPGGIWYIYCEGDSTVIRQDLLQYEIACEGEIRGNADISKIIMDLIDDNLKRRFIAGLADTIGSMAKSQRRFSDEHQILSLEIKGYNFNFVCNLCRLLYSVNCIADQVNWNHPNIHCTSDPHYRSWNKGFKLRILLDQYAKFGAFAFRTKAESSIENRSLQQQVHSAEKCEEREISIVPATVHPAEHDSRLPKIIRGGHYIHFRHFCAVLGCEHAPYGKIERHFSRVGELINPFPILCKDTSDKIKEIVKIDPILSQREYVDSDVSVSSLFEVFQKNENCKIYGNSDDNGYPIRKVIQAIAYIIADDSELSGKRPRKYSDVVWNHIDREPDISIKIRQPDLLTPLILIGNGRGALVGADNPRVYKKLVSRSAENKYKLCVRNITEEDLRNA
ncbi:hypothetical protein SDC9_56034 [bioreactor metagenome]|uniref:Uncharacterized protein n=1 Tax=bioreactor metagenome TaxID=1076179 RepID=A0A644X0R6_9ZZZZ